MSRLGFNSSWRLELARRIVLAVAYLTERGNLPRPPNWRYEFAQFCFLERYNSVAYLGGWATLWCSPLAQPWKFFTGDFMWKSAFFEVFQQELQNSTTFDGIFSYRYNMRLKSPCEIASDMTLWFFCFFKFQKKMGKFAAFIERSKAKSVSASGRPGALPLDLAGGSVPRLLLWARALRARHGPPLPNPKYATVTIYVSINKKALSSGDTLPLPQILNTPALSKTGRPA